VKEPHGSSEGSNRLVVQELPQGVRVAGQFLPVISGVNRGLTIQPADEPQAARWHV